MSRCRHLSSLTEPPLGLMVRAARATEYAHGEYTYIEYTHIRWKIGGRMCLTSPLLLQGCRRLTVASVRGDGFAEGAGLDADEPNLTPRALASQDAQRRELLAALRAPIVSTDLSGRITNFNPAAISLLGGPARL